MRKTFGVGLSAIALFGVTACGGGHGTAEELGQSMAEAYTRQDTDTLVDLACEKDKAKAERIDLEYIFGDALKSNLKVTFVRAKENGDKGTVTLKLAADDFSQNKEFAVIKEDGEWTICDR